MNKLQRIAAVSLAGISAALAGAYVADETANALKRGVVSLVESEAVSNLVLNAEKVVLEAVVKEATEDVARKIEEDIITEMFLPGYHRMLRGESLSDISSEPAPPVHSGKAYWINFNQDVTKEQIEEIVKSGTKREFQVLAMPAKSPDDNIFCIAVGEGYEPGTLSDEAKDKLGKISDPEKWTTQLLPTLK